jgi:hypothetical protein
VSSIIEDAIYLANVPPPSPLKRDQACRKLSFDNPIPEIILRTIAPEDDWEEVPSDDEASSAEEVPLAEQDVPSAEQDAPLAEQEVPLAEQEVPLAEQDAPLAEQERGCNDCGYIACSQDCGMRNFD